MTTYRVFCVTFLVLAGVVISGCGKSDNSLASGGGAPDRGLATDGKAPDGGSPSASSDSSAKRSAERDPCTVLEMADVEAVIGKLAGPPYRASGPNSLDPDPRGSACRYEAADFRGVAIDVAWSGGGKLQSMAAPASNLAAKTGMKGKLPKGAVPEGVEVAGDWDEASLIGCCHLNANYADSMITVEFSESRASVVQVATLVNKVIAHLDKPTSVDGRAGIESARQRALLRPKKRAVCDLVTRAEVEAVVGPLDGTPSGDDSKCVYKVRGKANSGDTPDQFATSVAWTWGYSDFRMEVAMHASAGASLAPPLGQLSIPETSDDYARKLGGLAKAMGGDIDKVKAFSHDLAHTTQTGIAGPWDDAAFLAPEFLAVKKDVGLKLEGLDSERAKKVAAKIMEKL